MKLRELMDWHGVAAYDRLLQSQHARTERAQMTLKKAAKFHNDAADLIRVVLSEAIAREAQKVMVGIFKRLDAEDLAGLPREAFGTPDVILTPKKHDPSYQKRDAHKAPTKEIHVEHTMRAGKTHEQKIALRDAAQVKPEEEFFARQLGLSIDSRMIRKIYGDGFRTGWGQREIYGPTPLPGQQAAALDGCRQIKFHIVWSYFDCEDVRHVFDMAFDAGWNACGEAMQ